MTLSPKHKQLQERAKTDLYFFCREILGYQEMTLKPHLELCNFVTNSTKKKRLMLMPRGSFKSSVVTIGYTLWRIIKDPNIRILISSETFNQAKTFLRAIKNHIEQNDIFKELFGDLTGTDVWRHDEFTVKNKVRSSRESTLACSGVGQTKVGLHYDLIILDDVVSNKTINTPEQLQKTIEHYKLLLSILEPGGELDIIGTRYSFADLYGHILDNDKDAFDLMVRGAYNPDGSLYFPTRLTKEYLDTQKKAMGGQHFSNQYLNEVIDQENAAFKQSWIKFYSQEPDGLRHFLTIDPASTQGKYSDYTGFVVSGIDQENNIFIIEARQIKASIGEVVQSIFSAVDRYNIGQEGCVGLEVNANQQTYKYILNEEMIKRGKYFAIKELIPSTQKSKANRIMGLQPWFENGKIYIKKVHYDLYEQIIHFPRTAHDDLIDAMCNILEVMSPADGKPILDKYAGSKLSQNEIEVWKEKDELCKKRKIVRTKMGW